MNHPFLMRMLDRLANLNEKVEPFPCRKLFLVAVISDLNPLPQFHDEVRPAGVRRSRLEHPRDIGMVHPRQCLALRFEAGDHAFRVHPQLDHLERDTSADRLRLLGHIDNPTAALADLLEQLVAADAVTDSLGRERLDAQSSRWFFRISRGWRSLTRARGIS